MRLSVKKNPPSYHDDDESACSIPVDNCEPNLIETKDYPISINEYESTRIELPNLVWHGYSNLPESLTLINTGESVQITGKWGLGKPYVTGGPLNGSYMFSQIHFHMPSEHSLNEKRYPLEMHAIHFKTSYLTQKRAMKKDDGTIVIVYFFEVAGQSPTNMSKLTQILSKIKEKNSSVEICQSNLVEDFMQIFCSNYFIYWGTAEVGDSNYSLQWIISCRKMVISEKEFCELEYFFREVSSGEIKRSMRDSKPNLGELYLVGDTVVQNCSNGQSSENRFIDPGKAGETSDKSRGCSVLSKYKGNFCASRDIKSSDKKVKEIYPSKTIEKILCSRCMNKSLQNRSTGMSLSQERCNVDKQTSTDKVCRYTDPIRCSENDSSISRSSASSGGDSEMESSSSCSGKQEVRSSEKKVEFQDSIESCYGREKTRVEGYPRITTKNSSNRTKKSYTKYKRRVTVPEDTSSDNEFMKRSTFMASYNVVKNANDGQEALVCDLKCTKSDRKSSGQKYNEKKAKKKDSKGSLSNDKKKREAKRKSKKKFDSSRAGNGNSDSVVVPDEDAGKKRKSTENRSTTLQESTKESVNVAKIKLRQNREENAEEAKTEVNENKQESTEYGKSEEANVGESTEYSDAQKTQTGNTIREGNFKQMGQHKPVILAPATVDDITFVLKSVGTMTTFPSNPSQSEGNNYSTEELISNTKIWKKDRRSKLRTPDKIIDVSETQERVPDRESNLTEARDKISSTSLLKEPKEKTREEEINNVLAEQSLFSILEKMSKDPSLNNFFKISDSENQEEEAIEPSIGSILAKISEDSSLACMLSKISEELLSRIRSGFKVEKTEPKSENSLRETPISSDIEKAGSDFGILTEIYGKKSAVQDQNQTSTDEEGINKFRNLMDHAAAVTLDSSWRDYRAVTKIVSKHLSSGSKLSVSPKKPKVRSASIKTAEGLEKVSKMVSLSKDLLIRDNRSADNTDNTVIIQSEHVIADASSKPSLTSSTKERSLVRVLMRVSKEPLLAVELANLLKRLPGGQSRSKDNSVGYVLSKLSREPSLAADLANILGEQPSNENENAKSSCLMRATKSSREKSLANILIAASRKTSMFPGGSKKNSLADIVKKISREPSISLDVIKILNRDSQYSGSVRLMEELLASVSAELAEETAKNPTSENISKPNSRVSSQIHEAQESFSSGISRKLHKKSSLGLRTEDLKKSLACFGSERPKKEQPVISDKSSKDPSYSRDLNSTLKMKLAGFSSDKSSKRGTESNVPVDSSLDTKRKNNLQAEMGPIMEKDVSRVAERTKSTKEHSLTGLIGGNSMSSANFLKVKSLSGTFPRERDKEDDEASVGGTTKSSKTQFFLNTSETEPYPTRTAVIDSQVETSLTAGTDPNLAEDMNRHASDRSLVNISDEVSEDPLFAKDFRVALNPESWDCVSVKNSKISKQCRENDVSGAGRGILEQSTAELLVAMTKAPSRALDLSKYSQDPPLVSILYKMSKKPTLVTNLANVLQSDSSSCLIINAKTGKSSSAALGSDMKMSSKLATEQDKMTKEQSLFKIFMDISKEPSLGVYLAKILKQKSRRIEIGKECSKEESLANILSRISAQPSLANDLANIFINGPWAKDLEESMREEPQLEVLAGMSSPKEIKTNSNDQLLVSISDRVSKEPQINLERVKVSKKYEVDSETSEKELCSRGLSVPERPTKENGLEQSEIPVRSSLISKEIASATQEVLPRKILTQISGAREILVPEMAEKTLTASSMDSTEKSLTEVVLRLSRESSLKTDNVKSLKAVSKENPAKNQITSLSAPRLGISKIDESNAHSLIRLPRKLSFGSNLVRARQEQICPVVPLPGFVGIRLKQPDIKGSASEEVSREQLISFDSTGNLKYASKAMSEEISGVSKLLETPRQQTESNGSDANVATCGASNWQSRTVPREGSRETERIRVNFETELNQSAVGSERPEADKLHRQEDLNESIKSRRSTETRKSGDDETSIGSNKKRALIASERSQSSYVQMRTRSSQTSTQSFIEEYYVKIHNDNSVIQECTGKVDPSDLRPGNAVNLELLPRTSVAIDDMNMEMQECLIQFDSKDKNGDLSLKANFLVSQQGNPTELDKATDHPRSLLSMSALKITDSSQSEISGNSFIRKKPLHFMSEDIEVESESGKKNRLREIRQ